MTDIVERLRGKPVRHDYFPEADRQEAADEIERLRTTLQTIVIEMPSDDIARLRRIAKAALEHRAFWKLCEESKPK